MKQASLDNGCVGVHMGVPQVDIQNTGRAQFHVLFLEILPYTLVFPLMHNKDP